METEKDMIYANVHTRQGLNLTIGSPELRVFILVALARVNASNWFNIMTWSLY